MIGILILIWVKANPVQITTSTGLNHVKKVFASPNKICTIRLSVNYPFCWGSYTYYSGSWQSPTTPYGEQWVIAGVMDHI